jgi:hypothetical protein
MENMLFGQPSIPLLEEGQGFCAALKWLIIGTLVEEAQTTPKSTDTWHTAHKTHTHIHTQPSNGSLLEL